MTRQPAIAGLVVWIATIGLVPAPLAARWWLAVPLVLVPRLAPVLPRVGRLGGRVPAGPLAAWPELAVGAGVLAAASFALPTGSGVAGLLAVPWLLVTLAGLAVASQRRHAWRSMPDLAVLATDGFLVAGAAFLVVERFALRPLGFEPAVVLLTAVHFSVDGSTLLAVAAILADGGSRAASGAVVALLAGIPLTALGWVAGTPIAALPGTIVVVAAGLLVSAALLGSLRPIAGLPTRGGMGRAVAAVRSVQGWRWPSAGPRR